VDAQVIGASDEVLTGERPRLLSLALGDEEAWELGLSCAGHIDVFVELVRPGGAWEEKFLTTLREARRDGRSLAVATLLAGPGTIGEKLLLLDGEIAAGGLGDPALDTAVAGAAARLLAQGLSRTVEIQTPLFAARCPSAFYKGNSQ
jgi:xanthine/CO dehydrogenase XdhC/CoxF family maturation factor